MKKLCILIGSIMMMISMVSVSYSQLIVPDSENYILTEDDQQVLNTEHINDPLRDGAYNMIDPEGNEQVVGIVSAGEKISTHENAKNKTMNLIKNIINYALGFVALIALIYLIYHGILILTAAGDDTQYKKGIKGVKFAVIAMGGIGLSWFFVSAVFWLLNIIIPSS